MTYLQLSEKRKVDWVSRIFVAVLMRSKGIIHARNVAKDFERYS